MLNISERQRSDVSFSFEIWSHLCVKLVYWKIPMSNYLGCPKNYRKVVVLLFCNLKNAVLYKMTILRSYYGRRRYFLTVFFQYTSLIYIYLIKFQKRLTRQIFGALRYWAWNMQHIRNEPAYLATIRLKNVASFLLNISERQRSDLSISPKIWSHICIKLVY